MITRFSFLNSSIIQPLGFMFRNFFSKLIDLEIVMYVRNLMIIFVLDGLVLDDEPLWEPLEWSLLQTWVIYIYIFTWAAEVIFSSRYGSYTNRDKVVWIGLFKTYSFLKAWFVGNIIAITVFVTLPFYFELTYAISYAVVWWNWYTSTFFFKFTSIFAIMMVLANIVRFQIRWLPHFSTYLLLATIAVLLLQLMYFTFIITLFGFFTDVSEFKGSGWSNLSRITHGPLKWGWGSEARDHFSYHRTTTVFWYKNDPLIAASMLFINLFILKFLFFLLLQLLAVVRVVYHSRELSHNFVTYFVSSIKQFFYFLLGLSGLVFLSLIYQFMRFPFELFWFSRLSFLGRLEVEICVDFLMSLLSFLI